MGLWNVIFHNTFLNGINQNNYNSNSIPKRFEMNAENTLGDKGNGRWSMEEHQKFLLGLQLYGKNWKKIEELVVTRNGSQIRSHAQKFFLKATGKISNLDEMTENIDPQMASPTFQKITRKSNNRPKKIPELSSPQFWSQMSLLLCDPNFSLWQLIDHKSGSSQKSLSSRKYSDEISQQPEEGSLEIIRKKLQLTTMECRSFNIFTSFENLN